MNDIGSHANACLRIYVQLRQTHCTKQEPKNDIIFYKQFQYSIIFLRVIFHQ